MKGPYPYADFADFYNNLTQLETSYDEIYRAIGTSIYFSVYFSDPTRSDHQAGKKNGLSGFEWSGLPILSPYPPLLNPPFYPYPKELTRIFMVDLIVVVVDTPQMHTFTML